MFGPFWARLPTSYGESIRDIDEGGRDRPPDRGQAPRRCVPDDPGPDRTRRRRRRPAAGAGEAVARSAAASAHPEGGEPATREPAAEGPRRRGDHAQGRDRAVPLER